MTLPAALIAFDGAAVLIGAGGVALMARSLGGKNAPHPLPPLEASAYRIRITGALLVAIALFLGGFTTAAWVTA